MRTLDELYAEFIQELFQHHINNIVKENAGFNKLSEGFNLEFSIPNGVFTTKIQDLNGNLVELDDAPYSIKMIHQDLTSFYSDAKKIFSYAYKEYITENASEESYLKLKASFEEVFYVVFCAKSEE